MDLQLFIPLSRSSSSGSNIGEGQNHENSSFIHSYDPISLTEPLSASDPSPTVPTVNTHPMVTHSKVGIYNPEVYAATKHHLPSDIDVVPTTYLQASKHAHWKAAMQDEYNALQSPCT